jgi:hypothetical protein
VIDVVGYEVVGQGDYFPVHPNICCLSCPMVTSDGIESVTGLYGVPFMPVQSLEILRIDDGVLAVRKAYPAERIAVAAPSVKQRQGHEKSSQPVRNRYRHGKIELNTTALHGLSLRT